MPHALLVASSSAALLLLLPALVPPAPRGALAAARQTAAAPDPERAAFMRRHFGRVLDMHHALVRGDLPEARTHARAVADAPDASGLTPAAAPYQAVMRRAASRAASSSEAEDLAAAGAAMLAACGDCHRAAGTMPAVPAPSASELGGVVGHMLAHEAAIDLMVQGLTVPSASLWHEGASALRTAPLRRRDLPRDPALTRAIAAEEDRVHALAERAATATDQRARVYVYSELLQSCGACHALHGNVWGPDRK